MKTSFLSLLVGAALLTMSSCASSDQHRGDLSRRDRARIDAGRRDHHRNDRRGSDEERARLKEAYRAGQRN